MPRTATAKSLISVQFLTCLEDRNDRGKLPLHRLHVGNQIIIVCPIFFLPPLYCWNKNRLNLPRRVVYSISCYLSSTFLDFDHNFALFGRCHPAHQSAPISSLYPLPSWDISSSDIPSLLFIILFPFGRRRRRRRAERRGAAMASFWHLAPFQVDVFPTLFFLRGKMIPLLSSPARNQCRGGRSVVSLSGRESFSRREGGIIIRTVIC